MTDSTRGKPTVGRLREILAQFPDDAVWWAYEGEVSGIIVSHPEVGAVLHNDGDVDIHRASEPEPEPTRGESSVTPDEIAATLDEVADTAAFAKPPLVMFPYQFSPIENPPIPDPRIWPKVK